MSLDVDGILADLDGQMDPDWAESAAQRVTRALACEEVDYLPVSLNCKLDPWYTIEPREYCWEKEKCLIYRLRPVRDGILIGDDRVLRVASLPDCGTIPSLFDSNIIIHRFEHWIRPVGDRKAVEKLIESGIPDLLNGRGWKVVKDCEYFLDALGNYPNLRRFVKVCFADVQGPLDNAYLVAGDEIYYWMIDAPELVEALVSLMADTQLAWYKMLTETFADAFKEGRASFASVGPARVHVVVDDCELISPEMYDRFSRPYTERVFARYGNMGSVHFCGHNARIRDCIRDTAGLVAADIYRLPAPDDPGFEAEIGAFQEKRIGLQYRCGGGHLIRKDGPEGITTGLHQFSYANSLDEARALMEELHGRV